MKRRKLWLLFPLITLLIIALSLYFRERPLLERATILETNRPRYQKFDSRYLWLSDGKILFIDNTPKGYTARVRDVKTGQDKPYKGKGTFFGDRPINDTIFRLSPDRKRLLWVSNNAIISTDENGTKLGHWDRQRGQGIYNKEWMPDSSHWVEAIEKSNGTYAKIHGISEEDKPEQKLQGLGDGIFLGFTSRKTLLTVPSEVPYTSPGQYEIVETLLDGKTKPQKTKFPFPQDSSIQNVAVSPQGDRLLWSVITNQPPNFLSKWLDRFRPLLPSEDELIFTFWTSDLDGKQLKRIGTIVVEDDSDPFPEDMKWKPDGKQVSFYYKDKLYAVSVE